MVCLHRKARKALDPERSKKNRVTATQFALNKAIANTSHSPRLDTSIGEENKVVKASLRDSSEGLTKEEARAQAQAYTVLKAENAYYRERWEWWKNQTRKTKVATVRKADTDRYARYLVNLHDAKEAENSQYFRP